MARHAAPLSCVLGALVAFQLPPVQAQPPDSAAASLPVSFERIRAALQRTPAFRPVVVDPSSDTPTFHVEIRERSRLLTPVQEEAFDPTFGLPSVGQLLMEGIVRISSAVVTHKRTRAERRARKEVDDALAAFCAVHSCSSQTKSP